MNIVIATQAIVAYASLKGLCHPKCMRKLMGSTLKSLAQLFQIPSESSGGCYVALDVNVNIHRLILKKIVYNLGKVILVVEIKEVYAGMAHGPQLT